MAKVVSVNISKKKGTIKQPIEEGFFKINHGLDGDAHAGDWNRQVSFLAVESIEKVGNKEIGLGPGKFAENITTEGVCLYKLPIGIRIEIGDVVFEVTQVGKECHFGCEIRKKLGDCIMPKEGIFAKVLQEGKIKTGDTIKIIYR
ncbi:MULTISPECIES: MOSC domain-containing protein [Clostridium]|nr:MULTISPECIES: MOSC domain-containing protein [Clostridium]MBC2394409.1 MOSC domain-containing protein [Clostridium acetobutylicum]MBC2583371.1 MOSC domain-containing protein [Clostridium acetobutylicum]